MYVILKYKSKQNISQGQEEDNLSIDLSQLHYNQTVIKYISAIKIENPTTNSMCYKKEMEKREYSI